MEKENIIDCLLIGHNEMDFAEYEKSIRNMGLNTGAYRDLNLNFINYNKRPYTLPEIFNIFHYQDFDKKNGTAPFFHVSESFSAAIAYLGSYLHRKEYTFSYVNAFQYSRVELAEKLRKENILTIAIITTLYVSVFPIIEIIDFIKTYNRTARIIVGGPFVSTRGRTMADQEIKYLFASVIGADFYVDSAQGEATLIKIIDALKNNAPLDNINNIFYHQVGSDLKRTPVLSENNQLSENMVDWSLFKKDAGEFVNIRTSISCPFSCSFCGFPQHAGQYQLASVELVEKELEKLAQIGTVKMVHFIDDTFNIPVKRFKEILRMLIKNKFGFEWHGFFRSQFADREMVELMKQSGCKGVYLGLESGSDQILKNMNKAADVEKYLQGIKLLKEYGIVTYGNFIIGFPGETTETVKDTIQFIKASGLDFFRAQSWYCEHITPIWKEKELYHLKGESFEWSHATMDSQTAAGLVETIFCSVENPTWIPQYNFCFDGIWHLVHRGVSLQQVHRFLRSFNRAVMEKLQEPARGEAGYETLKQIEQACSKTGGSEKYEVEEDTSIDVSQVDFDF